METLIAELEAATEGSRELDGEIWLAENHSCVPPGAEIYWMRPGTVGWSVPRDQMLRRSAFDVPPYTTSLDAALTLVPEGWRLELQQALEGQWWDAWLFLFGKCTDDPDGDQPCSNEGGKPTPALALCIAALKARQATEGV